jgi:hypothetical protein
MEVLQTSALPLGYGAGAEKNSVEGGCRKAGAKSLSALNFPSVTSQCETSAETGTYGRRC